MGRPINKKHIGDGAGKIQVSAVRFAAGAEVASATESHIVSQKGTRRFRVTDGTKTEVCTLVGTNPGSLAASEFCITSTDDGGSISQVTKITNRKIQLESVYWTKWASGSTGTLPTVEAEILSISAANPGAVVTDAAHTFTTGDKVSIRNCLGMVEANITSSYTITVTGATAFTLGVDTSAYTAHTGGTGVATKAPASIAGQADVQHLDAQAS